MVPRPPLQRMVVAIEMQADRNNIGGRGSSLHLAALDIIAKWTMVQDPKIVRQWTLEMVAELRGAIAIAQKAAHAANTPEPLKVHELREALKAIQQHLAEGA